MTKNASKKETTKMVTIKSKKEIELKLGKKVINSKNNLNYKYV